MSPASVLSLLEIGAEEEIAYETVQEVAAATFDSASVFLAESGDAIWSSAAAGCEIQRKQSAAACVQTTPKKHSSKAAQASTPKRSILNARLGALVRENNSLKRTLAATQGQLNTQTKFYKRTLTIENLKSNSVLLRYYTGISIYAVFELIVEQLMEVSGGSKIRALSLSNCVLMILVKIRRNIGNLMLGHLFGVDQKTVWKIFQVFTPCLAKIFSKLIISPSSETTRRNLPESFKSSRQFRRTRFIIDCTEIPIQRPKSLLARAQTYSNYKGRNTAKVLIACTPTGGVAFISKAWGGRVSDIELTRRSGFYELILPGDHLLADRGFRITEDLAAKGATLSVPSFTRGKPQLPGLSTERSAAISRVRIHVERCIGRIKFFKILSETLPITLLPQLDNFLTIVGGLCNLLPPLVASKKSSDH